VPDTYSPERRTALMRRVRAKNTAVEVRVRRALHGRGFRFRLHPDDLPGHPDIVLPKYRTVVFVHGCFWHQHDCRKGQTPDSNRAFWVSKLSRNVARDAEHEEALRSAGWSVITVWECQLHDEEAMGQWLETQLRSRVTGR